MTWSQHRLCVERAIRCGCLIVWIALTKVVCPSYVPMILDTGFESLRMVVSGHGHMRRGLVVNQVTTQRRWLVMASCYDSQGYTVRCGCVSASEESMKYSD